MNDMKNGIMNQRLKRLRRTGGAGSSQQTAAECVMAMDIANMSGVVNKEGIVAANDVTMAPDNYDSDEDLIKILEEAYADEALVQDLYDRMQADKDFSSRMKAAMSNPQYKERLTAAIEASGYMQKAIADSPEMQKLKDAEENNALLQPFQDEKVVAQIESLKDDPKKAAMMMAQSEDKLKAVAGDLVLGVQEYRDDFEPDADDLIDKFRTIELNGYKAFLDIAMKDKRVQNAVVNGLMDAMEEERDQA
ncbi:hypothetical protein CYMTET_15509 [Cymbomonas tetramitiformis]|uniref:Uncharacterized protein n=1 Tax=Cymbomonas tetramitiformis TaxID=36881 RepID=A0AAE0GEF9_9CHLO|nr:hypothetical protein CYMTET_15509 [Cymbomonas tetramitiformis]